MRKIIDQKGMVLGRINIIDLSAVILLISLITSLFLFVWAYKRHNMNKDMRWVSVKIRLEDTDPAFRGIITKGDTEKDSFGNTIGTLVDVSHIEPTKVWVVVDNKMITTIDHPVRKDIVIDADILCVKKDGILYHKAMPVKIGGKILFETDLYDISGTISGLKDKDKNKNEG